MFQIQSIVYSMLIFQIFKLVFVFTQNTIDYQKKV